LPSATTFSTKRNARAAPSVVTTPLSSAVTRTDPLLTGTGARLAWTPKRLDTSFRTWSSTPAGTPRSVVITRNPPPRVPVAADPMSR
jgi:hypothetical protein